MCAPGFGSGSDATPESPSAQAIPGRSSSLNAVLGFDRAGARGARIWGDPGGSVANRHPSRSACGSPVDTRGSRQENRRDPSCVAGHRRLARSRRRLGPATPHGPESRHDRSRIVPSLVHDRAAQVRTTIGTHRACCARIVPANRATTGPEIVPLRARLPFHWSKSPLRRSKWSFHRFRALAGKSRSAATTCLCR